MNLTTLLVIVLLICLFGAWPQWSYSRNWGYGPTGILGVILLVVLFLILTGNVDIGSHSSHPLRIR